jgi:hypothetical protein
MKKIVVCILVALTLLLACQPAYARYVNISIMDAGLIINSSGRATCTGLMNLYDTSLTAKLTVELKKQSGTSWTTEKSWESSGLAFTYLSQPYNVVHGVYQVKITAKVYDSSNTLLETQTLLSPIANY